jgi:hypothetical protein
MPYIRKHWMDRLAERSDLCSMLTHLTRSKVDNNGNEKMNPIDVLLKILRERQLIGSSTDSGFIIGNTRAVCFQDAPLSAIAQNLYFEQKYRADNPRARIRYTPFGLMFPKISVYRNGGRPVVYEETEVAKRILPANEHWRIVSFDLSDDNYFVDWTHERDWRLPGDFHFALEETIVLVSKADMYKVFIDRARAIRDVDILRAIAGIVTLHHLVY